MNKKNSVKLFLFGLLFVSVSSIQAGVWQNFKLRLHKNKINSVKSLMLLMDEKNIGVAIHQKRDAIILQTKHRKMKWHQLEKSLIPYIRLGCEREGGFLTTEGLKESMNRQLVHNVYRGAVDPADIMRFSGKITVGDHGRFKRKAYNAARHYAIHNIAAPNVIAVKRIEARYCVRKGQIRNAVYFLINKNAHSNKIQNLYTVYLAQPRLLNVIRMAYKSALYPAYKYTRKLQNTVSYYEGQFDAKRGIGRVIFEVSGSNELVMRVNYYNRSAFPMTARLYRKKFLELDGKKYPIVTNIQESGESDLRVSGNGCRLKNNRKIKIRSRSSCQMSVSVLVPGFTARLQKISFLDGDKKYNLRAISQYND